MIDIEFSSLKKFSRLAGLLYIIVIGAGLFAEVFVRQAMSVPHDVLATAHRIQSSEMLYRLGFVADLINFICGLPVILLFWILFRQSHPYIVTLAILFVIISNAIFANNILHQLNPLLLYSNDTFLQVFQPKQVAAMATLSLQLQSQGYAIGLVFFGFYCILIGFLLCKTGFIPKILGLLYALAGLSYILHSFIMFLSAGFHDPLFPYILFPAFLGESFVAVWLLIMGIKEYQK